MSGSLAIRGGVRAPHFELAGSPGRLVLSRRRPGRAVFLDGPWLYASRHGRIFRTRDDGRSWERVTALPRDPLRRVAELSRLASRLLRHEVRALTRTPAGRLVAANRRAVFHGVAGDRWLAPSRVETGELPLLPPMCLSAGPGEVVVFGEYGSWCRHRPMRLFESEDGGRSFRPIHTFAAGDVLHIHNLVWDPERGHWWVLAGDHEHEPGIGQLSADRRRFEWLVRGEQRFRAVEVFDFGDRLVYATDTEREPNALISLEKSSGRAERLQRFDGSCIYACRFGGIFALTTTVEPSKVNHSDWAALWLSRDGIRFEKALEARKDVWHPDYFQFGSLVLPRGVGASEAVAVSGQAVRGLDGQLCFGSWAAGASA